YLRGIAVPRGDPARVGSLLDQYFVCGDPCPVFEALADDRHGICDQLWAWLAVRTHRDVVVADCCAFFDRFYDGVSDSIRGGETRWAKLIFQIVRSFCPTRMRCGCRQDVSSTDRIQGS